MSLCCRTGHTLTLPLTLSLNPSQPPHLLPFSHPFRPLHLTPPPVPPSPFPLLPFRTPRARRPCPCAAAPATPTAAGCCWPTARAACCPTREATPPCTTPHCGGTWACCSCCWASSRMGRGSGRSWQGGRAVYVFRDTMRFPGRWHLCGISETGIGCRSGRPPTEHIPARYVRAASAHNVLLPVPYAMPVVLSSSDTLLPCPPRVPCPRSYVDARNAAGCTPLHYAVWGRQSGSVQVGSKGAAWGRKGAAGEGRGQQGKGTEGTRATWRWLGCWVQVRSNEPRTF